MCVRFCVDRARLIVVTCALLALAAAGCGAAGAGIKGADDDCAIIVTDDDIPSGSATAGALYVADAALGKKLLTADVVAVAKGFRAGGFSCVEVIDSHDEAIDPAPFSAMGVPVLTPSALKQDWTWPFFGPMHLKKRRLAALVGFHSPAGSKDGFRVHTINDNVKGLWINGKPSGEVAHLILGLASVNVPVGLVTGDHNATAEAAALIPKVEQVTVRWRDKKGQVKFLSSDQAGKRLMEAARRAAIAALSPPRFSTPVRVDLEMHSARTVAALAPRMSQTYQALAKKMPRLAKELGPFDFSSTLKIDKRRLSWQAPDGKRAFVSIAFAASFLRGQRNMAKVSQGFRAFAAGKYAEALTAYEVALKQNPFDVATRCRMGAVYQKLGLPQKAREQFAWGVRDLDEVGSHQMKSWCLLGMAQTNLVLGEYKPAGSFAHRVLKLPDYKGRHKQAGAVLQAVVCFKTAASGASPAPFRLSCRGAELRFILDRLETVYSYLSIKQKRHGFSYAEAKKKVRARVEAAKNEAEYRAALNGFLKRFKDGHLRINYEKAATGKGKKKKLPPAVTHRWLPGRVLLTRISRLWGDPKPIEKGLARGLKKLKRARALVVDLRGNGGGSDAIAFAYITRMVAKPIALGRISVRLSREVLARYPHYAKMLSPDAARPGYSRWWDYNVPSNTTRGFKGPVVVLIDRACYSSCEGTALAFKSSGLGRLYGQATGGGSANPIKIRLPVTAGKLMVPTWIQVMPNGKLLEDNGVSPHVALPVGEDALKRALADVRKRLRR